MHIELITPEGMVWSGETVGVQVPGTKGPFEILHNHAAIISTLDEGRITVKQNDDAPLSFHTKRGVVEVLSNRITVLAEAITPDPGNRPATQPGSDPA